MEERPQISVLLCTLNPQKDNFERAVQSIIGQTFRSWELLIYDDGSDVEKSDYIKSVASKDDRIKYLRSNINRGLAAGLNECLKQARGKYLARMDDDDISLPERFAKQVEFLDRHLEYGWVGTIAELFDDTGVWGKADRSVTPDEYSFLHSSPFIHPSVMFRKDVLEAVGGYQSKKITARCEDYELFIRLYSEGYRGYNLQQVLFQYREESRKLKRSWKYCYYESLVRWQGFKKLNILSICTFPYVLKPLAVRIIVLCPKIAQKIRVNRSGGDHVAR